LALWPPWDAMFANVIEIVSSLSAIQNNISQYSHLWLNHPRKVPMCIFCYVTFWCRHEVAQCCQWSVSTDVSWI
jgi:hypothetical protein